MLISQKSKCAGCYALRVGAEGYTCALKYLLTFKKVAAEEFMGPKPLEPCPKPKNNSEFKKAKIDAERSINKHNTVKPKKSA